MKFTYQASVIKPSMLVVKLSGVLDAGTSVELEMGISGQLKDPSISKIVLDVPALTFISSSGLRVMMLMIKSLAPKKGRLYMVGATSQIIGLIRMSGMTKWIVMRDSIQECESE